MAVSDKKGAGSSEGRKGGEIWMASKSKWGNDKRREQEVEERRGEEKKWRGSVKDGKVELASG